VLTIDKLFTVSDFAGEAELARNRLDALLQTLRTIRMIPEVRPLALSITSAIQSSHPSAPHA
jgi:hypothetical protein